MLPHGVHGAVGDQEAHQVLLPPEGKENGAVAGDGGGFPVVVIGPQMPVHKTVPVAVQTGRNGKRPDSLLVFEQDQFRPARITRPPVYGIGENDAGGIHRSLVARGVGGRWRRVAPATPRCLPGRGVKQGLFAGGNCQKKQQRNHQSSHSSHFFSRPRWEKHTGFPITLQKIFMFCMVDFYVLKDLCIFFAFRNLHFLPLWSTM